MIASICARAPTRWRRPGAVRDRSASAPRAGARQHGARAAEAGQRRRRARRRAQQACRPPGPQARGRGRRRPTSSTSVACCTPVRAARRTSATPGEADVRVERRERRRALACEGAEFARSVARQFLLVRVLDRERLGPGLLVFCPRMDRPRAGDATPTAVRCPPALLLVVGDDVQRGRRCGRRLRCGRAHDVARRVGARVPGASWLS